MNLGNLWLLDILFNSITDVLIKFFHHNAVTSFHHEGFVFYFTLTPKNICRDILVHKFWIDQKLFVLKEISDLPY